MSDPASPSSATPETSRGLDPVLIAVFALCALVAAGFIFWRASTQVEIDGTDFSFAPLTIDTQKLRVERDEKFKAVHLDRVPQQWETLLEAARQVNRAQFDLPGSPAEASTLMNNLHYQANEVIPATGFSGFVAAGQPIREACRKGLDELLGAVQKSALTIEQASENPPADRFSLYRDNCGKILPTLLSRGLLTSGGTWSSAAAPTIVDILSRYRWAHIIADQRDPWTQLTPYEAKLFARWRIEQAEGYTVETRMKFLSEYARLFPNENVDYAQGVLEYQSGDLRGALNSFEKLAAADPNKGYEGYIQFLENRISAGGPSVASSRAKTTAESAQDTPADENEKIH